MRANKNALMSMDHNSSVSPFEIVSLLNAGSPPLLKTANDNDSWVDTTYKSWSNLITVVNAVSKEKCGKQRF